MVCEPSSDRSPLYIRVSYSSVTVRAYPISSRHLFRRIPPRKAPMRRPPCDVYSMSTNQTLRLEIHSAVPPKLINPPNGMCGVCCLVYHERMVSIRRDYGHWWRGKSQQSTVGRDEYLSRDAFARERDSVLIEMLFRIRTSLHRYMQTTCNLTA